jgi:predicted metal-binding protein
VQDLYPEIAAEWHPTKNGDLLPSQIKGTHTAAVWWLCRHCDREWKVSPRNRAGGGAGCRRCAAQKSARKRRTPQTGESLVEKFPDLAAEWNTSRNTEFSPDDVLPGSAHRVWWICSKCGNEWQARIWTRAKKGFGCKRCASAQQSVQKKIPKPGKSLADLKPELLALWHPTLNPNINPKDLTPSSHTKVWWLCPECGNEWEAAPGSTGCRPCSMKRAGRNKARPLPGRSLAELYPALAEQWDLERNAPLTAADVAAGSDTKYWWECSDCQHRWQAKPSNRSKQIYLCPSCKSVWERP